MSPNFAARSDVRRRDARDLRTWARCRRNVIFQDPASIAPPTRPVNPAFASLLDRIAALDDAIAPSLEPDAPRRTVGAHLAALVDAGVLVAMLPADQGGLGLCDAPGGARMLMALLRASGAANLSLARLLEGHANAVRLVEICGTQVQRARVADDTKAGSLFGIWVTDGARPVSIVPDARGFRLDGVKGFSSAVHAVRRALVTARREDGASIMVLVPAGDPARIGPGPGRLTGMTGGDTGSYDLSGLIVTPDDILGASGDYLREPEFSGGAWRASAAALGGMDGLIGELLDRLCARGRASNPHQAARIGDALILRETAALWVARAADAVENPALAAGDVTGIVNLARTAVERAGMDLIALVQRALGVQAFVTGQRVERMMRDLATYLRQPAPDEALVEAAMWFTARPWAEARS